MLGKGAFGRMQKTCKKNSLSLHETLYWTDAPRSMAMLVLSIPLLAAMAGLFLVGAPHGDGLAFGMPTDTAAPFSMQLSGTSELCRIPRGVRHAPPTASRGERVFSLPRSCGWTEGEPWLTPVNRSSASKHSSACNQSLHIDASPPADGSRFELVATPPRRSHSLPGEMCSARSLREECSLLSCNLATLRRDMQKMQELMDEVVGVLVYSDDMALRERDVLYRSGNVIRLDSLDRADESGERHPAGAKYSFRRPVLVRRSLHAVMRHYNRAPKPLQHHWHRSHQNQTL